MNEAHLNQIARELSLGLNRIQAAAQLLDEGATVPFIARYRKEATGTLDEVAITTIRDRLAALAELDKRREAILSSLAERNLLTEELRGGVLGAETLTKLEDLYLPFKPKRRTRAMIAREKGLEPLSNLLLLQRPDLRPEQEAQVFVNREKGVETAVDALAGARDIIAEMASEDAVVREELRRLMRREGLIVSRLVKGKETEGAKFHDYFEWQEPLVKAASHRILAIFRGENEEFLRVKLEAPEDKSLAILQRRFLKGSGPAAEQVKEALEDGLKRLLAPSIETEVRQEVKTRADEEAIRVFAQNVRELLMAAPLGRKAVMAVDPGFRTGCKVVCLDPQGKLLHNTTVYLAQSERQASEAAATLTGLCKTYKIEAVAIGNGTAGRETETFIRGLPLSAPVPIIMVNESGASIYSASEVARAEFPDHDITVRGAVSIGRRLLDPLAELVKIDPRSIGVGQYQHDVDQARLKQSLDDVVSSCVNGVGVEANSASPQLLTSVSGLGPQLARNIVAWRDENGPFQSRRDLLKVSRLGPKAFEQAAGFLRIHGAANPLDASAVHPESYHLVEKMAGDLKCTIADLLNKPQLRESIVLERYVTPTAGLPTLKDIIQELAKPGRDPRQSFEVFAFDQGVHKLEDLQPGMVLPGIVTNVTKFGAFVDVGVHQDGLVHISQLADRFVKDPADVVKVSQKVTVRVLEVDLQRRRVALSMKTGGGSS